MTRKVTRKPMRSDRRASGTGEDNSSEEEAGRNRNAADTTMTTTEAHPDHLAALQKSFNGKLNSWSVTKFSQAP